jgi:hypothetical protein
MSNAYLTRMPAGIPGALTRLEAAVTVPEIYDTSYPCLKFGIPVKMSSGKIRPLAGSEAIADVYGILVRPYPTQYSSSEALGTSTPYTSQMATVMVKGFMTILLSFGTAAKGAQVYACVAATGGHTIGTWGDSSDSAYCIAVANCFFTGAADSDGNVEISYNILR